MPNGGQLLIATRNADKPPAIAPLGAAKIPKWIVLEVRDTSSGMDKAKLAHIVRGLLYYQTRRQGPVRQSAGFIQPAPN